jgi:chromosome segregation protein
VQASVKVLSAEAGDDFVLASNSSVANRQAERFADFAVLSLDGELFYHETASGKKVTHSTEKLSIREQIKEQEAQLKTALAQLEKLGKAVEKQEKSIATAVEKLTASREIYQNWLTKQQEVAHRQKILENQLASIVAEKSRLTNQISNTLDAQKANQKSADGLRADLKQLSSSDKVEKSIEEAVELAAIADVKLADARDEFHKLSNELSAKRSQNTALIKRADELKQQAVAEENARKEAKEQERIAFEKAQRAQRVQQLTQKVLVALQGVIEASEQEKQQMVLAQTSSNEQLNVIRLDLSTKRKQVDELSEQIHKIELDSASVDSKIENLTERVQNEVYLTVDVLLKDFGPEVKVVLPDPKDSAKHIEIDYVRKDQEVRYAKALRDLRALGKVNPLAMEEFDALEERYKHLSTQLEDVEKSRKDLLDMVAQIDEKTMASFKSAFEDTAAQFEEVFKVLFPGGKGRLKLIDPTNMLTSGVEVEATPAGKRITRLSLLSGGERSLVAVAMLVAIFKARPSPFYVMDEVEAALDDVNLSRLLKIFRELKKDSQLLIITHQKRTMEVADALYGITMRRDGITQVISQKI